MPIGDWQFWVVTILALGAAGYLLRNVLPVPFFTKRAKRKKHERPATLTISAKREVPRSIGAETKPGE